MMSKVTSTIFLILTLSLYCQAQNTDLEKTGDILQFVIPAAAVGSAIIYTDDSKPGWQLAQSLGSSLLLTHSLKRIIDRKRPNGGKWSFPSGHTTLAFGGAAFLQKRHGWSVGIPAYALAGYVAWSRVHADKHYWSDVGVGALIGISSSFVFTKPYQIKESTLVFSSSPGYISLTISF